MDTELSPKAAEIVACARSLLAAGGYNGFSYADISESVRISKASIHHHFPSKAELVQTVVARYREEARTGMATLERQIPEALKPRRVAIRSEEARETIEANRQIEAPKAA